MNSHLESYNNIVDENDGVNLQSSYIADSEEKAENEEEITSEI